VIARRADEPADGKRAACARKRLDDRAQRIGAVIRWSLRVRQGFQEDTEEICLPVSVGALWIEKAIGWHWLLPGFSGRSRASDHERDVGAGGAEMQAIRSTYSGAVRVSAPSNP
jgi:hypothetical protein